MEALQHHSSSTDHNNNNNNNNHNNNHAPSNDKATAATTTSPAITSSSATPNSVSKSNDSGITSSNNNSSGGSKREFRYDGEVRPDSVLMRALRLIDWAFWGNFWFMLGSLAYLIAGAPIPRLWYVRYMHLRIESWSAVVDWMEWNGAIVRGQLVVGHPTRDLLQLAAAAGSRRLYHRLALLHARLVPECTSSMLQMMNSRVNERMNQYIGSIGLTELMAMSRMCLCVMRVIGTSAH